jgi:hypothetical protein
MPIAHNTKLVSHIDCAGGGQVWVDGNRLYVAHMKAPSGTSIYDITDPKAPRLLSKLELPEGWHSHKVRARGDVMIVNHEENGQSVVNNFSGGNFRGGLTIYNVADPTAPRQIAKWETGGKGVHRYDFDGRYAYVSATMEGYVGYIVVILDLADPARPSEVSRWWIPGQWQAGNEPYPWDDFVEPKCHHPLRHGDRLYVSYWHHGLYILDISDLTKPKMVGHHRRSPAFPHPTHTCLVMPEKLKGRKVMIVSDEDVAKLRPAAPAFAWVYDISEESLPTPIATINVPGLDIDGSAKPAMTGCHQPSERFTGTIIPFAWFAQGLRIFDVADPFAPKQVGYYVPDAPQGQTRASSNDVTMDDRGLIYLVDRIRGVDVIEMHI